MERGKKTISGKDFYVREVPTVYDVDDLGRPIIPGAEKDVKEKAAAFPGHWERNWRCWYHASIVFHLGLFGIAGSQMIGYGKRIALAQYPKMAAGLLASSLIIGLVPCRLRGFDQQFIIDAPDQDEPDLDT